MAIGIAIQTPKSKTSRANARNNKNAVVVIQPNASQNSNGNKKKSKRKRSKRNKRSKGGFAITERSFFRARLLAPDVFGPFRQPRMGASSRTGLGIDLTDTSLIGSATTTVLGLQCASNYITTSSTIFNAINETTAFGAVAGSTTPGSQFPASSQVADVNLTGCDIVIYYIGNPLNVQGEVILGCAIPLSVLATYQSLFFYPGTLKFPVADLIQSPKRVSFRKLSPIADEFVTTSSGNADVDLPFVFTSGLPVGGAVKLLITRTWEYRTTTISNSVIPYERVGENHSGDVAAYQDARADIAEMNSPVTDAVPDGISQTLGSLLGLGGATGAVTALNYMRSKRNEAVRGGQTSHLIDDDAMTPFMQALDRYRDRGEL